MAFHIDHCCFYLWIGAANGGFAGGCCVEAGRGATMAVPKLLAALELVS